MENPQNELRSKTTNRHTALKLRFEAIVDVFVSRLVLAYRKGNLVFNIMYVKFWIDNDFFVRNLEASVKALLAQVAFTKDFFFFT